MEEIRLNLTRTAPSPMFSAGSPNSFRDHEAMTCPFQAQWNVLPEICRWLPIIQKHADAINCYRGLTGRAKQARPQDATSSSAFQNAL
jgi:hypothetical protein